MIVRIRVKFVLIIGLAYFVLPVAVFSLGACCFGLDFFLFGDFNDLASCFEFFNLFSCQVYVEIFFVNEDKGVERIGELGREALVKLVKYSLQLEYSKFVDVALFVTEILEMFVFFAQFGVFLVLVVDFLFEFLDFLDAGV